MKKFISNFCLKGLVAMGFGPIVYAIIMLILELSNVDINLDGLAIFKGIISTSLMAFLIAGANNIYQIDRLNLGIKIMIHGFILYLIYLIVYLLNDWIKKDLKVIGIFSIIFILGYILIWLIIYIVEKIKANNLNKQLKEKSIN